MTTIQVNVRRDHLTTITTSKNPLHAIAELIWNGLDADADRIAVRLDYNGLGGIEAIRVQDNGLGVSYSEAPSLFGNLGGSWKGQKRRTPSGRSLHGTFGKGRFKAFALGSLVEWNTTVEHEGALVDFTIKGWINNLETFRLSEVTTSSRTHTGTEVVISNPRHDFRSLKDPEAHLELANTFAAYLTEYPGIRIDYEGTILDPAQVRDRLDTYKFEFATHDGASIPIALDIVEWKNTKERALHLCDASGVSLHTVAPGIQAPGYKFTAYLKSELIRKLNKDNLLVLEEMHPDLHRLVDAAKEKMRSHFRHRAAEDAAALVKTWKEEKIYPYEGDPHGEVDRAERQVFDVVAININSYLSDFETSSLTNKRFTFQLLKQAIGENPETLQLIFQDVINLPRDRQDDLAELLKKTTLTAIIASAKVVADRLNFIRGLELMLFDEKSKKELLERDQLHQIIATETWIFGESFNLTCNEESLNDVLAKHLHLLGQREDDDSTVTREDGSSGRIDLMLSRSVPQPRAEEREYLVVELKRPSKKVDSQVLSQVESYALAVAQDERFKDTKTLWTFWAVSNEMTDEARRKARQRNRPEGLVFDDEELRIRVWAKSWGQIIQECKGRLEFLKAHLEYEADRDSAKAYLQKAHEKYLPSSLEREGAGSIGAGEASSVTQELDAPT